MADEDLHDYFAAPEHRRWVVGWVWVAAAVAAVPFVAVAWWTHRPDMWPPVAVDVAVAGLLSLMFRRSAKT